LQFSANAQPAANTKITGRVNSLQGEPMAGVTVAVKNSSIGTSTDSSGIFTLTAPIDGILEISYIGYKKLEIPIVVKPNLP
jgi:iron complex outermembrane receptor protein